MAHFWAQFSLLTLKRRHCVLGIWKLVEHKHLHCVFGKHPGAIGNDAGQDTANNDSAGSNQEQRQHYVQRRSLGTEHCTSSLLPQAEMTLQGLSASLGAKAKVILTGHGRASPQ